MLVPPIMSPSRVQEARTIGEAAGWPDLCREGRCRATGRCQGRLRPFVQGGPRCYPGCVRDAFRVLVGVDRSEEGIERLFAMLGREEAGLGSDDPDGDVLDTELVLLLPLLILEEVPEGVAAR